MSNTTTPLDSLANISLTAACVLTERALTNIVENNELCDILQDYVSKEYLADIIANNTGGTTIGNESDPIFSMVNEYLARLSDLDATSSQLSIKLVNKLSAYMQKSALNDYAKLSLLDDYAKKEDLPDFDQYVLTSVLSDFADKHDLNTKYNNTGGEIAGDVDIASALLVRKNISQGQSLTSGTGVSGTLEETRINNVQMSGENCIALNKSSAFGIQSFAANQSKAYSKNSTAFGNSTAYGSYSLAQGAASNAYGYASHVEGRETQAGLSDYIGCSSNLTAYGCDAHAEGDHTKAIGNFSHAEGSFTEAHDIYSHTEGNYTKVLSGNAGHAEGQQTEVSANYAHAEGTYSKAYGEGSHAEGDNTLAQGAKAHAEGSRTSAIGQSSHAEGLSSIAFGVNSHAEGDQTYAGGQKSHAEGGETSTFGFASHTEGKSTIARASFSHAEGTAVEILSNDQYSFAWSGKALANSDLTDFSKYYKSHGNGTFNINPNNGISGFYIGDTSLAECLANGIVGGNTYNLDRRYGGTISSNVVITQDLNLSGKLNVCSSLAGGNSSIATGDRSFAYGYKVSAIGNYTHAEGDQTYAEGQKSHAEGGEVSALGFASHAEGRSTIARASYSHVEGVKSETQQNDLYSYVWQGARQGPALSSIDWYKSNGQGTFNINPVGGISGFYIGDKSLNTIINEKAAGDGISPYIYGENATANGNYSRAIGDHVSANGIASYAFGLSAKANSKCAIAVGDRVSATAEYSFAEGLSSKATAVGAFAGGVQTSAVGAQAFAFGSKALANGQCALAVGDQTSATKDAATALGKENLAGAVGSFAAGKDLSVVAESDYSAVFGNNNRISSSYALDGEGGVKCAAIFGVDNEIAHTASVDQSSALFIFGSNNTIKSDTSVDNNVFVGGRNNYTKRSSASFVYGESNNLLSGYNCALIGNNLTSDSVSNVFICGKEAKAGSNQQFVWNGTDSAYQTADNKPGTFNINPKNGISGFYIDSKTFVECVLSAIQVIMGKTDISESTNAATLKNVLGITDIETKVVELQEATGIAVDTSDNANLGINGRLNSLETSISILNECISGDGESSAGSISANIASISTDMYGGTKYIAGGSVPIKGITSQVATLEDAVSGSIVENDYGESERVSADSMIGRITMLSNAIYDEYDAAEETSNGLSAQLSILQQDVSTISTNAFSIDTQSPTLSTRINELNQKVSNISTELTTLQTTVEGMQTTEETSPEDEENNG